jgi:hypothetical protein
VTFHRFDLLEPSPVSFFAGKSRCHKRAYDFQRQLYSNHARSETKDVAVVMFARLSRRIGIAAKRGANAVHFAGGD